MTTTVDLVALERRSWQALSAESSTAKSFYRQVLGDAVVMVLPGGMLLSDRDENIESIGNSSPWTSFKLERPQVLLPTEDTMVVSYGDVAQREGAPEYSALMSSMYVRRGKDWKLALHQQTPR